MPFVREGVDLVGGDWEDVQRIAAVLEELRGRRVVRVAGTDFPRAKVAWKMAALSQALLYRNLALVDAVSLAWNARGGLASALAARSLTETVALTNDFAGKVCKRAKAGNLDAIDEVTMRHTFATKLPRLDGDVVDPAIQAVNVLTMVDKLDGVIPGVRSTYDFLSEICHPNHFGTTQMFGRVVREEFAFDLAQDDAWSKPSLFHTIHASAGLVTLVPDLLDDIERVMPEIIRLNEEIPLMPDRSRRR
jgi:hypothetical protein